MPESKLADFWWEEEVKESSECVLFIVNRVSRD